MSYTVLLCDDALGYRKLARAVLEAHGVRVVGEADNGRTCLQVLADVQPEVVLLDVNMPVLDGLTALPDILAAAPAAQVIMLSTAPTEDVAERSRDLGARGYLRKPDNILDLPALVDDAVAV